jgi:hypothetical protein
MPVDHRHTCHRRRWDDDNSISIDCQERVEASSQRKRLHSISRAAASLVVAPASATLWLLTLERYALQLWQPLCKRKLHGNLLIPTSTTRRPSPLVGILLLFLLIVVVNVVASASSSSSSGGCRERSHDVSVEGCQKLVILSRKQPTAADELERRSQRPPRQRHGAPLGDGQHDGHR